MHATSHSHWNPILLMWFLTLCCWLIVTLPYWPEMRRCVLGMDLVAMGIAFYLLVQRHRTDRIHAGLKLGLESVAFVLGIVAGLFHP